MLRYSLKDTFALMLLVATGMGMICHVFPPTLEPTGDTYILWVAAGMCFGGAVSGLFGKPWIGIATGLVIQLLLIDLLSLP
jgi:hypothetical protein